MFRSAVAYTPIQVDIRIFKNGVYFYQCEKLSGTIAPPSTPDVSSSFKKRFKKEELSRQFSTPLPDEEDTNKILITNARNNPTLANPQTKIVQKEEIPSKHLSEFSETETKKQNIEEPKIVNSFTSNECTNNIEKETQTKSTSVRYSKKIIPALVRSNTDHQLSSRPIGKPFKGKPPLNAFSRIGCYRVHPNTTGKSKTSTIANKTKQQRCSTAF